MTENTDELYDYYFKGAGVENCLHFAEADLLVWEKERNKYQHPIYLVTLIICTEYLLQGLIYLKTNKPIQTMDIKNLYEISITEEVELPKELLDNMDKLCEYQYEFMKSAEAHMNINQIEDLVDTGYKFSVDEYKTVCSALRKVYNQIIAEKEKNEH